MAFRKTINLPKVESRDHKMLHQSRRSAKEMAEEMRKPDRMMVKTVRIGKG